MSTHQEVTCSYSPQVPTAGGTVIRTYRVVPTGQLQREWYHPPQTASTGLGWRSRQLSPSSVYPLHPKHRSISRGEPGKSGVVLLTDLLLVNPVTHAPLKMKPRLFKWDEAQHWLSSSFVASDERRRRSYADDHTLLPSASQRGRQSWGAQLDDGKTETKRVDTVLVSYPIMRKWDRSLYTCAQDV
jgi:hypothetical protein